MKRPVFRVLTAAAMGLASLTGALGQDFTVELDVKGRRIEGTPLAWTSSHVTVLARDGHLWDFPPAEAKDFRKTASGFESYSQGDLRARLLQEFGEGYDVSGTGHYLVVHPAGQRDRWAPRFEELYRSFVHYFTARGFRPQELRFPLIAVVFPRQQEFHSYAGKTGAPLMPGVLGYYSPTTNRILLYDVTAGRSEDADWRVNAETIIHEAAHQSAFNTGIHSRYALPPRWVVEGLGTMFEAPGVWNSRQLARQSDRVNRYRLEAFQKYASARRRKGSLAQFVSSDREFRADPDGAYAEAWALTFFLVETEPRKYMQYLGKTASRRSFSQYRLPERLHDFAEVFGQDFSMLEARFLRFVDALR